MTTFSFNPFARAVRTNLASLLQAYLSENTLLNHRFQASLTRERARSYVQEHPLYSPAGIIHAGSRHSPRRKPP